MNLSQNGITELEIKDGSVAALKQRLDETFGHRNTLWSRGAQWEPIGAVHDECLSDAATEPELAVYLELLDQADDAPQMVPQADDDYLLVIPLRRDGLLRYVVTVELKTREPNAYFQAARLFACEYSQSHENEKLQQERDTFIEQISDDFEELTFLRSIAETLALSGVTNDLLEIADNVLPFLQRSLKAREVMLVLPADTEGSDDDPAALSVATAIRSDGTSVAEATCLQIVAKYRDEAERHPVVRNQIKGSPEESEFPGVREFMILSLHKNENCHGWLLALNRNRQEDRRAAGKRWALSHLEFGTGEAGVLNSAAAMLATQANNVELFSQKERLLVNVVRALVSAIDAKDPYTCGHSERVALYAQKIGLKLGLDEAYCDQLYLTGLLHDVGKIGVSDSTLGKPGHLDDGEFEEIKRHTEVGWEILHELEQLRYVFAGVVHHHERYDGRGYPDGLAGEAIPLDARILAVVDSFDAMTSDRPYRQGMSDEKAYRILIEGAGTQWDPGILDAFISILPDLIKIRSDYQRPVQAVRPHGGAADDGVIGSDAGGDLIATD